MATLTLLKFCAGFVSVVHLMRAVGAVFDFAGIDLATQSCLATITGIETDASAWALASLPVRLGGLGLHSCADTAAIAHIAATFDGEACLSSLVTPYVLPHAMLLDEDDTFLASLEDPRLAPFDSVLEKIQDVLQARDNYGGRGQKVWSATAHDERRKALIDAMTEELGRSGQLQGSALALKQVQIRARIQSCSGQHASAWLYGNAEADPRLWLSPAELAVAIRLRLGLPIAPTPSICRLCGTGSADVDGVHARSCFSGGRRTRMHNALRDVIADFARRGLLAPAVERPVFSNTERKRPDISYVRDGTTVVLDVAVTFPLQPSNPQYAKRAAEKPGGAATAYATAVKEGKYRGIIDNEPNPREWLAVPLVVDTFGAWCPGALTELRQIARKSAHPDTWTAGAARDVADQAGSPDAIEGADQVEPAGAPGGRAGGRAADAQTAERKLRRERRRFRHAADLAASGSSAVEPFPDSDESDSDGESESGSSGDVGGRGGGDDRDGGDGSGPGSGNVGPGGGLSLAGQPASDASAEPGQPEAPSEAGLGNGSATNDRSGLAAAPGGVSHPARGSSALWGCLRRLAAGVSTGERDAGRLSPGTKPAPGVPGPTPGDGPYRAGPAPATGGKPVPAPPSPGLLA
ncbi:hypothetical protein DIPPA_10064 [Diplonema papillatum]|nr:hypothetical protein DIPPA_10064 [Diplonema papillatum]